MARTAEPKMPKLPKSLGACVDMYYDARQKRLELEKVADAQKKVETFIFDHILNNIPKGDSGAVGKRFKAIRKEDDKYSIEKDDDFYKFVKATSSFDLLNRAINQAAVRSRMEDPKFMKKYPNGVPGTKKFKALTLSVTKI